jgi:hypothetical protein
LAHPTMMKKTTNSGLILTQHEDLEAHIRLKTILRNDKQKHIVYSNFPDIRTVETRVFWGVFSWSLVKPKQRWIRRNAVIDIHGLPCTPADIVRDYLEYYHPTRNRCTGVEARDYETHKAAPLYVRPSVLGDAVYIDLKAAYYSIVKNIGWNVNYLPGNWLLPGRAPLDFPLSEDKSARNYLVSIGLPSPVTIWTGYKFQYKSGSNPHINLGLWSVVMDTLHAIAGIAVSLDARYVHTDGYILPARNADKLLMEIERFNLTASIRSAGDAYVFGFGNYRVGDKQTKSFNPDRVQKSYSTIRDVPTNWLRKTVNEIVKRGIPERIYKESLFR